MTELAPPAGSNFRERERLKRKRNRWLAKVKALPEAERGFLLEALLTLAKPADAPAAPVPRERRKRPAAAVEAPAPQLSLSLDKLRASVPASGVIVGGRADGCAYTLVSIDDEGIPTVRYSLPDWPFPVQSAILPPVRLVKAAR